MAKLIVGVNDLATVNPELAKEWDYGKNEKTPQDYTVGSHTNIWWVCKYGHEWQAVIKNRNLGQGCPFCSGRYPIQGINDLATTKPELVKEWNYEKNGDLKPFNVTSHSNKKVWWKCDKGHEWQSVIDSRANGHGCPYCSKCNTQVLRGFNDLATTNPDFASEWNYEKNGDLKPFNVTSYSNKKVWWKCEKGHEWFVTVNSRISYNSGCPYCSNKKVLVGFNDLYTTNPELVKEWHPTKNGALTPQKTIKGSGKKVWWKCKYGHEWQAVVKDRIKGIGCPYCSGNLPIIEKTDLATINPELIKEWNYDKNMGLKDGYGRDISTPDKVTPNSILKVWWTCEKGHEWQATIASRNKGYGCPYCANRKVLKGFNDLETINPDVAKEWNYEKNGNLRPSELVSGSSKKVWWKCQYGHEWRAIVNDRTRGIGCPYCSGSKSERLTYKILKEWNIPFRAEKKFESDLKVKYYPYDVWISKYGLLIELDGMQHFTSKIEYFERDIPFEKRVEHDNIKNQFALEKRIPLLRIPYTYNPDTEEEKIRQLLKEFIETRKIPQEIIDFYEQYDFSNYSHIAKEMNTMA